MTDFKAKQDQRPRAERHSLLAVLSSRLRFYFRVPPAFYEKHPLLGWMRRVLQMFWQAGMKFLEIDGEQCAAAFSYYAFFALFPLLLLFVTLGSQIWDHATVVNYILDNVGYYMPFDSTDRRMVDVVIHGIVDVNGGVSTLATLGLIWSASRFFHAMVRGVNSAWDTIEYPWWQLPLRSMMMLVLVASALFIGMLVPLVIGYLRRTALLHWETLSNTLELAVLFVPSLVLFYGLSMFFKFAPRRRTHFSEVAFSTLVATLLLQVCRHLFELYVYDVSNFNTVYGTFAVVIVLLMWIYLSGVIIIYGGCLCAAQARVFGRAKYVSRAQMHPAGTKLLGRPL